MLHSPVCTSTPPPPHAPCVCFFPPPSLASYPRRFPLYHSCFLNFRLILSSSFLCFVSCCSHFALFSPISACLPVVISQCPSFPLVIFSLRVSLLPHASITLLHATSSPHSSRSPVATIGRQESFQRNSNLNEDKIVQHEAHVATCERCCQIELISQT